MQSVDTSTPLQCCQISSIFLELYQLGKRRYRISFLCLIEEDARTGCWGHKKRRRRNRIKGILHIEMLNNCYYSSTVVMLIKARKGKLETHKERVRDATVTFTKLHASRPRKNYTPPRPAGFYINSTRSPSLLRCKFWAVFTHLGFVVRVAV